MLEVTAIQTALKEKKLYDGQIDGIAGKATTRGIETALTQAGISFDSWPDERRQIAFEQLVYRDAKIEVGVIDGLVGEATRYARSVWEARQKGDKSAESWRDADLAATAAVPVAAPKVPNAPGWPRQSEAEMTGFYGARGTNQAKLTFPYPMRIAWDPSKTVTSTQCNKKLVQHFQRIFEQTLAHYGIDELRRLRLDMFGGLLNVRLMRGSTSAWSIHSWGCAFDMDPERNQLKFHRAQATLDDPPYAKFWEFVYGEGAIGLGPERDYDWMHFQFARL